MASLSASGLVPRSAAIAGSEVAITVESMFSMNSATATIRGTIRLGATGVGAILATPALRFNENVRPVTCGPVGHYGGNAKRGLKRRGLSYEELADRLKEMSVEENDLGYCK